MRYWKPYGHCLQVQSQVGVTQRLDNRWSSFIRIVSLSIALDLQIMYCCQLLWMKKWVHNAKPGEKCVFDWSAWDDIYQVLKKRHWVKDKEKERGWNLLLVRVIVGAFTQRWTSKMLLVVRRLHRHHAPGARDSRARGSAFISNHIVLNSSVQ